MILAVIHHIHDPEGWTKALEGDHSWPPGFNLHSFVEADDKHVGFCVWEAPSETELQAALDGNFGDAARNEVIPAQLRHMGGHSAEDYVPSWARSGAE
jgi:hypothetical protein